MDNRESERLRSVELCIALALAAMPVLAGCSMNLAKSPTVLKTVIGTVEPYFHNREIDRVHFEQLSNNVYTFQWNWYRNLIVDTSAGLVIIDPMNAEMSAALKAELDEAFPGKSVHSLIYSHYHLDHTSGGDVFSPQHVVAHVKVPQYLSRVDSSDVVPPTQLIEGDENFSIGGVEFEGLYLGFSHTDTLYAFHFPEDRLLFTPDLALVRTAPPTGVPDRHAPGYDLALERVSQLDFDVLVPSHFGYGSKSDLLAWREMLNDQRALCNEAIDLYGGPGVREGQWRRYFNHVYGPMKKKYGDWHGFNEMFVLNLVRDIVGEALGD